MKILHQELGCPVRHPIPVSAHLTTTRRRHPPQAFSFSSAALLPRPRPHRRLAFSSWASVHLRPSRLPDRRWVWLSSLTVSAARLRRPRDRPRHRPRPQVSSSLALALQGRHLRRLDFSFSVSGRRHRGHLRRRASFSFLEPHPRLRGNPLPRRELASFSSALWFPRRLLRGNSAPRLHRPPRVSFSLAPESLLHRLHPPQVSFSSAELLLP